MWGTPRGVRPAPHGELLHVTQDFSGSPVILRNTVILPQEAWGLPLTHVHRALSLCGLQGPGRHPASCPRGGQAEAAQATQGLVPRGRRPHLGAASLHEGKGKKCVSTDENTPRHCSGSVELFFPISISISPLESHQLQAKHREAKGSEREQSQTTDCTLPMTCGSFNPSPAPHRSALSEVPPSTASLCALRV